MTKLAEKPAAAEPAEDTTAPRVARVVHEMHVQQNKAGSKFAQWEAVAPEGASFEDLIDPAAWRRVQEHKRPAIRQGDEIRILAFDRSWVVWVFVSHASNSGLVISAFANTKPQGPVEHLAEDDQYKVVWAGIGYEVRRKRDGLKMGPGSWPDAAAAETALRNLYPARVS